METLIITIIIGVIGGICGLKLKIPAGAIIGSLFFVAIFNIFTGMAHVHPYMKLFAQICTGTFIGSKFKRSDLESLKHLVKPGIMLVLVMTSVNFLITFFLHTFSDLDLITALFATAPGGLMDMSLISFDFGADPSKVAVLQLIRLISVITLIPTMIKTLFAKEKKEKELEKAKKEEEQREEEQRKEEEKQKEFEYEKLDKEEREIYLKAEINKEITNKEEIKKVEINKEEIKKVENISSKNNDKIIKKHLKDTNKFNLNRFKRLLITLAIGFIFGLLGNKLKVPAGAISFSMIFVSYYNLKTEKAFFPIKITRFIQMLGGTLIGSRITLEDVTSLKHIIFPVFIIIIGFLLLNLIVGYILYKNTNLDLLTAFFAASPGGMTDMTIISIEFGANSSQVAALHFLRLIFVISVYPILISAITRFFG